jgi:hypothetical protein
MDIHYADREAGLLAIIRDVFTEFELQIDSCLLMEYYLTLLYPAISLVNKPYGLKLHCYDMLFTSDCY